MELQLLGVTFLMFAAPQAHPGMMVRDRQGAGAFCSQREGVSPAPG